MNRRNASITVAILFVAGCTTPAVETSNAMYDIGNVPENIAVLAAPDQNLASARLRPEDDCYWYEHNGPVEMTLVPLRAEGGSPICVRRST